MFPLVEAEQLFVGDQIQDAVDPALFLGIDIELRRADDRNAFPVPQEMDVDLRGSSRDRLRVVERANAYPLISPYEGRISPLRASFDDLLRLSMISMVPWGKTWRA